LEKQVWICRDDAGVAQVYAETARDLAFGLGVAMAQDRLWQMEMLRRLAGGRLAELLGDRPIGGASLHLFGPRTLAMDRFYRSLRMYPVGQEERSLLSQEGRAVMDGFAAGVNAWLARCRSRDLPPECLLSGMRPDPWTAEDSLAIGKLIGWLLELAFPAKPILAALAADSTLRSILPPGLADGRRIISDGASPGGEELPPGPASLELLARQALGLAGPGMGSNSWVVSGRRTGSGKPLLCNDPHLLFGLPSIWYPVALHGPEHRVMGGTMPGIPAILVGRNDFLAWGLTAVMADDGDYYRETLDESGRRYLRDGEWHPVEVVEERFCVRGKSEAVRGSLPFVRHGGVLCPLLPRADGTPTLSFRWTGLEAWRCLEAFLGMNQARDLAEFEAALEKLAVPAQNVVVADTKGTIAYFCAGKFPRRAWAGHGPLILDGASPDHAWNGYLPWAELPRAINPVEGFLVTANNRVARDLPPTIAGSFWEPPYRAARIAQLLRQCRDAGVQDMARIQTDDLSLQAAGILAQRVRPVAQALQDPRAQRAASLLLTWDCRMTADSAAAALYHFFYQDLLRRWFQPRLEQRAPGLFLRYFSLLHLAVGAVDSALITTHGAWFPDGAKPAVEQSLAGAWDRTTARLGADPAAWHWGSLHTLTFHHSLGRTQHWAARAITWLAQLNRGPYPRPGDGMTVNLGAFPLTQPFDVAVGPSYRQIVDLADPEGSQWIIAGGASGDPRSAHYADQVDSWLRGQYRPMRLHPLTEARRGVVLRLVPADGALGHPHAGDG
jgi:penicillin amidase